jgi:hypothetical protein
MNRHHLTLSLVLSAMLGGLSMHTAQAGGAITKCVDGAGRITLTDQACDARTVSSSIAVPGTPPDTADIPDNAPLAGGQRGTYQPLPLRQARWTPASLPAPHAPLSSDMATMKQARVQMMLQDAAPRTRLASR